MTSKIVVNNIGSDTGINTVTFDSNVERGSSNLHSTGLNVNNTFVHSTGIALGAGSTIGAVTGVTTYYGDGSQLTGISAGTALSGSTNNTVTTVTGANAIQGESNLTFDGTSLKVGNNFTPHSEGDNLVIGGSGWQGMTIYGEGGGSVIQFADDADNRVGQILYSHSTNSMIFRTNGNVDRLKVDSSGNLLMNSGYGSVATAYGVRAWMRYRGDTNALDGSANVSSVTDHSTGSFSMNFTTAMVDANYAVIGEVGYNDTSLNIGITHSGTHSAPTTTSMRFSVGVNYNSNLSDERYISIAIVR